MIENLAGKVAVVTGAASGIGLALCERFLDEGMRVVMSDVSSDALRAAASGFDADVLAVPGDVVSWEAMQELASAAFDRFGAVHVLCNNAGVQLDRRVWEYTREEWEWLLGVDFGGVVHGLHAFLPRMIAAGEPGHVVNTASVGGLLAFPGIAPYVAAKFAVVGLSEGVALDLKAAQHPIGVSVLCPGPTVSALRENSASLRPASTGADPSSVAHVARMPAAEVAGMVVDAVRAGRFWILTHPEYGEMMRERLDGILETDTVFAASVL